MTAGSAAVEPERQPLISSMISSIEPKAKNRPTEGAGASGLWPAAGSSAAEATP